MRVKSVEKINILKNKLPNSNQNPLGINIEKEVFQPIKFDIAKVQTLEGGKTYNWSYDVNLSDDQMMPTYFWKYVSQQWMFIAGLDAKGNDPDSKWQPQQLS